MNRTTQFSETPATFELKETGFNAQPTNLKFNAAEEPTNAVFQIEWDDFDTGTLDD